MRVMILSYFDTPRYVFYFVFVVFHFSKDLIRVFFIILLLIVCSFSAVAAVAAAPECSITKNITVSITMACALS